MNVGKLTRPLSTQAGKIFLLPNGSILWPPFHQACTYMLAPGRHCMHNGNVAHTSHLGWNSMLTVLLTMTMRPGPSWWSLPLLMGNDFVVVLQGQRKPAFAYGLSRLATGVSTVTPHEVLGQLLDALASFGHPSIQVHEVRGHEGDPWNELADQLAKHFARNPASWGNVCWTSLHSLAGADFDRRWAWLQSASPSLRAAFPPLFEEQVIQTSRPRTSALPPSELSEITKTEVHLLLEAMSFNVLALGNEDVAEGRSSRALRLDAQLHARRTAIVGLQEARTAQGADVTDNYKIFSSGFEVTGRAHHYGCELWLSKHAIIATSSDGTTFTANAFRPLVLLAEPRRLLVQLDGPLRLLRFVGHAPCVSTVHSIDNVQAWWDDTARVLRKHAHSGYFLAFLDSNAPLATIDTGNIGMYGAETMNPQGSIFENFIHHLDLYVPSTLGYHRGIHTTWTHPRGGRLRRDYCAVNESLLPAVQSTSVCSSLDLGFTHEDHSPVCIALDAWVSVATHDPKPKWCPRKLRDSDTIAAFQAALASLPMPTWNTDVDTHAHQMEQQILALAISFFGATTSPSRIRPTLTEATLNLISFKRQVLDMMRSVSSMEKPEYKDHLTAIEIQLRPMIARDQRAWYDDWLRGVQASGDIHDHRAMFRKLTRLGRKKNGTPSGPRPLPRLKLPSGEPVESSLQCHQVWNDQFAVVEAGISMAPSELLDIHDAHPRETSDDFDPTCLPSLWDIQKIIGGLRRGKAPGPNHITPDIVKAGGGPMALHLCAVMTKAAAGKHEPLAWKGGILVPLYKGKGRTDDPSSYRAIYVSNVTSKIYHGFLRSHVKDLWGRCIDAMQQGGRARFGTDVSHHLLQAYLAWSRAKRQPMAVLFVDLHSAFYSVVRSSLFDADQGDDLLFQALHRLGIKPADLEDIIQQVRRDHALQGLSRHGQELLQDFFHASFYQMQHVPGVTMTTRGTRPGDPLGDVLFNLAFRLVMRDARKLFLDQTGLPWLGAPAPCEDLANPGDLPPAGFSQLAFVDDLACIVHTHDAHSLPGLLGLMTSCLHDAARLRGLHLNYQPGKTEAMVSISGPGSRALKHQLFTEGNRELPVVSEAQSFRLRLVPFYKHLGTFLQDRAITSRDRQHRVASARKAAGQLLRPFFSKRQISAACKKHIFESLVTSKHVYQAHVWSWLTQRELDLWAGALRDQVRVLARPALHGLPYFDFTPAELFALADLNGPLDIVHANRLRYFHRLMHCGTVLIWQLLFATSGSESWMAALRSSFDWLRTFSTYKHLPLGDDVIDWILCAQISDRWKGLIKSALKSSLNFRREHAKSKVHTWTIHSKLGLMGAHIALPSALAIPKTSVRRVTCGACELQFSSTRALAMHCVHAHGYRRWPKYYILGPQCLACGSMYTTRARALVHLANSNACALRYRACFPPISESMAQELDLADRDVAHSMKREGWHATKALQPVYKCPFVALPPPGPDAEKMHRAWLSRTQEIGVGFSQMFGLVEPLPPSHASDVDIVPFVMNSAQGSHVGAAGVFMNDGLSLSTARVFLKFKVFVHFFSGYRRLHDLQWHIEHQISEEDTIIYCLSIDICLQKERSDLSDEKTLLWWEDRMAAGQVIGIGGGPSCESWSAARSIPGGPPPLRDAARPWGLPALTMRQWSQVQVGSTLIWFLLRLLVTAGFLEHPCFPTWLLSQQPPSIRAQDVVRLLSRLACFSVTTIDQCVVGCAARKPTTFLLLRMTRTRDFLLSLGFAGRCNHHGHAALAGRTPDGQFRTAIAKVYPPKLNYALALGIRQFVSSRCDQCSDRVPADFVPLQSNDFVHADLVQPDYHG